jgi:hypothetical protein
MSRGAYMRFRSKDQYLCNDNAYAVIKSGDTTVNTLFIANVLERDAAP